MWVGGDLKEVQKIMSGIDSVNAYGHFWSEVESQTKGHGFKVIG